MLIDTLPKSKEELKKSLKKSFEDIFGEIKGEDTEVAQMLNIWVDRQWELISYLKKLYDGRMKDV